ncbi:MAG: plastocyanin/azurin family copper-binding protein [Dehalococcoidia bacterium]
MAACSSDSTPTPAATPMPAATPTPEATKEGGASSDIVDFTHQDLVVSVGTTITWVNRDSASHTSTATAGSSLRWNSRLLKTGESYAVTFNEPGTYPYRCSIHPRMTGTVTVNP